MLRKRLKENDFKLFIVQVMNLKITMQKIFSKNQKNIFQKMVRLAASFQVGLFLFVLPASTTYQMKDFGFGSGGTSGANSTTYSMQAITGEDTAGKLTGTTYNLGPGLIYENQAGVPGAPTFTNPNDYYNKLKLVINTGGNPSDTKYAIAISTDNFATITNYVQNDNTVGAVLGSEDRQTYTNWGGAGGILIIGLAANTTYQVKVKAMQGKFTETEYSLVSSVATISPTLSFSIDTDTQSSPPFVINFGNMNPGSLNVSPQNIRTFLSTNGENGAKIYVSGTNAGLYSPVANYKINAVSGDLSSLSEGFGAQGTSVAQISGGPLSISTSYNQGGNIVGTIDTTIREIFSTPGPIVSAMGRFLLKAKPATTAAPMSDYAEILTVIASASF